MKISFVSQYFHPEQFSNNSIAKDLVCRGHEVIATVCVPNYPSGSFFPGYSNIKRRTEHWEGIDIQRVYTLPRGNSPLSLFGNYISYAVAGSLKLLFSKDRPDVIFASEPSPVTLIIPAIVQRWRTGSPLVCWVQDIWPESLIFTLDIKNKLLIKFLEGLSGWIYRRVDVVLVQSPAFIPMLTRFGIDLDKIHVFPNTAPDGFEPIVIKDAVEQGGLLPRKGFKIVFAGNIGESQDFDTITNAAKLLHEKYDIAWVIIGTGRDLERIKKKVVEQGISEYFSFLGRFPESEMPYFFCHADVLLVSLKNTEIFEMTVPYKVQCYMACGRPILASLSGEGARTVKTAGAGLVSTPENAESMAEKISELIEMDVLSREKMGEKGREYYLKNYSAEHIYNKLEGWLTEAVALSSTKK